MEMITSFLSTTPIAMFLTPVILILVVLLVVINIHRKNSGVDSVNATVVSTPSVVPVTVVAPVAQMPTPPVLEAVQVPVPVSSPVVEVPKVVEVAPVAEAIDVVPIVETPAPSIQSWKPSAPEPVTEERPFIEEVKLDPVITEPLVTEVASTPTEPVFVETVQEMPPVAETIPVTALETAVIDGVPMKVVEPVV